MKVTIYALHLGFGGVERYVSTIANILAKEHEVEIISTYKTTDQPVFPIDSNVNITYLLKELPNNAAFKTAVKRKNILRIIKEGLYACKVLYLRYTKNKKSIKQNQSDVILSTRIFHNRLIGKYAPSHSIKITGEHNHPHGNEKYIEDVVASCKGFDYFIPISKELCKLYEQKLDPQTNICYLPFCIDDSGVSSHTFFNQLRLVNVGRFSAEKGYQDLIKVMDYLIHHEGVKATLDLIGSGDLEPAIKKDIEQYQLQDAIIMHGFQKKDYVYEQYKKASLYVMTSFTESFGIVLLEAMSCGVPCVAFDSAEGAREIIADGKDGALIKQRSIQAMAMKIKELSGQPKMLEEMSLNAFKKANQYSYQNCETSWLNLFRSFHDENKENVE